MEKLKTFVIRYIDKAGNVHEIKKINRAQSNSIPRAVASLLSSQPQYKGKYIHLVNDEEETSDTYLNGLRIRSWEQNKIVWERN